MRRIGFLLALFLCSSAFAEPFTAERMWALKRLGDPAITPDGKFAVVPLTTYDMAENKGATD
jgi:hypothetical protein